jgi:hypothetical protein
MGEQWREVEGWPGYSVSDMGRVRGIRGWVLKPRNSGDGYHAVTLCAKGRKSQRYVHRIVLTAFRGEPTADRPEGAHLNGVKTDNRLSNLKWSDPVENASHKEGHGTVTCGMQNGCAKLTDDDVRQVRAWLAAGRTHQWISDQFDVKRQAITKISSGQRWGSLK